jgi:two-component system, NarL family, sensor kinase
VGLLAGGVVLEALKDTGHPMLWEQSLALAPMSLSFATVGALIGSRRPGNPIGWLCLAFGLVVAELHCARQYATYVLVIAPGSLPGGDWAAWAAVWPVELSALLPILLFLLFPHGRLLSVRWRPLAWLAVAASTVQLLASALSDVNYANAGLSFARHPIRLLDIDVARTAYSTAQLVTTAVLLGPWSRWWYGCIALRARSASS